MDKQALIDGLNEDLAGELSAIIQYITYAAKATGPYRPQLVDFFQVTNPTGVPHQVVELDPGFPAPDSWAGTSSILPPRTAFSGGLPSRSWSKSFPRDTESSGATSPLSRRTPPRFTSPDDAPYPAP